MRHSVRCFAVSITFAIAASLTAMTAMGQPAGEQPKVVPAAASAATVIPALIRYSSAAARPGDKAGEASATFLIFKDAQGGEPLWTETQTVWFDAAGRYDVYLGATSGAGLPADLFSSGEARWLEVQVAGAAAEPRALLTSVPYALKAADATTLGGLPVSAFALAGAVNGQSGNAMAGARVTPEVAASTVTTPGGKAGYLPVYSGTTAIDDSIVFESGTKLGINTTTPAATLDVQGSIDSRGALSMESTGTATTAAGKASEPLDFVSSVYSSTSKAASSPTFALQAEAAGNNTAAPSATLNVLYGTGTTRAETGLSISSKGLIKFATGQTFPGAGSGTITGITTASPLAGSGTTGAVALSLNLPALETSLNSKYAQLGVANKFAAPVTFAVPVTFAATQTFPGIPGGGTITGITTASPLTGAGTKGSVALSLNVTALETTLNAKYAQLGAANTFTAPVTFATGQTFPGTSTITSVTAGTGLIGGGSTGAVKLSLDPKSIPTLTGSPVFTSAADGIQGITNANYTSVAGVVGQAGNASGIGGGISGVWGDAYAHVGVLGTSNEYSGVQGISTNSYGVQGSSTTNTAVLGTSTSGTGVSGLSTTSNGVAGYTAGGTLNTAGVLGKAGSVSGITGVLGGVWGDSYQQVGVEGTSSQSIGVYGKSSSATGVQGVSTVGAGVSGSSSSGAGLVGSSVTGQGAFAYTIGNTDGTAGMLGVAGTRTNFDGIVGVWGDAANHVGVQGTSNVYAGVQGSSLSGPGLQGNSTSGNGIHGVSQSTSGIFAESYSTSGGDAAVYGYAHNGALGVFGFSPQFGIEGESGGNSGVGALRSVFINGPAAVWGDTSSAGYAVVGTTDNGIAGEFINSSPSQSAMYVGNFYNGNSTVAEIAGENGACTFFGNGDVLCTGTVSAAVKVDDGARAVTTYAVQSAESWSEDAGSAKLVNGVAHVVLDPTFAQTVNTSVDYHVFLTPGGDSEGLYVSNKTAQGFDVHEQRGGHSSIAFDYRIMAKRAGHETERLKDVTGRMQKQTRQREQMHGNTAANIPTEDRTDSHP